ncbi:hypothetical protein [Rhizobium mongolense]|uniref:Phosphopantetheinyl transferase (Holo-ACP synthase) n=1 Tax=Rhizobium mongolense TaxID=57676 RepID=A0A7W6RRS5_9HYPH|nr:hypothetical protein [Rhizobium mongolense]MBB4277247.1 phosphopantetheinyl transferase (holo-ACP synthase) [Rhizobium mongolense]
MTEQTPPRYQVKGLAVLDVPANMIVGRFGTKEAARKAAETLNKTGKLSR